MKRKALVVGATGLIGKNVVNQLIQNEAFEKITILVRKSSGLNHENLEEIIVNFDRLEEYEQYFQVNDVFSCLGTTIKIAKTKENFRKVDYDYSLKVAELASKANVQNLLLISSMGANSHSNIFYSKVKGEVERDVRAFHFSGLFIFRPSLLLGERIEIRLGEKVAEKISTIMPFIFTGPLKKYKPIKGETVAKAMINCALSGTKGELIMESNGIDSISRK
ncbi:oxidoreductase [Bacillus sp. JJ664]